MSSSVMLVSVASSTTAAACSTPRTGSPVAVAAATSLPAVSGSAMLPHTTSMSAPVARMRAMVCSAFGDGWERPVSTIRPQPAAAIPAARNSPRPPRPPVMM